MNNIFKKLPLPGDIAFSSPVKLGFYSRSVRFFTKSKWSHCFYIGPEYMGMYMAIETDLKVQVVPFQKEYIEKKEDVYELYRPIKATLSDVHTASKATFYITAGETYGFFQIPWFALRSLFKWFFNKTLKNNIETDGVICSELLIIYLQGLGGLYLDAFKHCKINETSPEDIYEIVLSRPDLFEFVGERKC